MRAAIATARRSRTVTMPAPVNGLDLVSPFTASRPGYALLLDNWICREQGLVTRPGYEKTHQYASPVRRMFSYPGKLIAQTDNYFADGDQILTTVSTGHGWAGARMNNAGLHHLFVVNGASQARVYNGSVMKIAAIEGIDSRELTTVVEHNKRLYFADKAKPIIWYLPHDAIAGPVKPIMLRSNIGRSGEIVALGSMGTRLLIATKNQLLAYEITDPSHVGGIAIAGVVDIPEPVSKHSIKNGAILTRSGLLQIEELFASRDSEKAIISKSRSIDRVTISTSETVESLSNQLILLLDERPAAGGIETIQWVRSDTGGWSRFKGLEKALSWVEHEGALYFGTRDGKVCRLREGADEDRPVEAVLCARPERFGSTAKKQFLRMRPMYRAHKPYRPLIKLLVDHRALPDGVRARDYSTKYWKWSDVKWENMPMKWMREYTSEREPWRSVRGNGVEAATMMGVRTKSQMELTEYDIIYESGKN